MAGFQVFRDDGSLQFDANLMTYQLYQKGTTYSGSRFGSNTSPSTFKLPFPSSDTWNYMMALRPIGYSAALGGISYDGNGNPFSVYQCNGPVGSYLEYYIFSKASKFASAGYGLELFDDAGNLTFSSNQEIMSIAGLISGSAGASTTLSAGRTYATVQPAFAGISYELGGVYRNGQAEVEGPEPPSGSESTIWTRQVYGKLFGMQITDNVISINEVSYDDVLGQTNQGPTPRPAMDNWSAPVNNAMILDVTGF